jgi:hypothetical protein
MTEHAIVLKRAGRRGEHTTVFPFLSRQTDARLTDWYYNETFFQSWLQLEAGHVKHDRTRDTAYESMTQGLSIPK